MSGRRGALFYAILWPVVYVAAVFVFALVYWLLPVREFRHSASQYELALAEEAQAIAEDLHAAVVSVVRDRTGETAVTTEKWRIDWEPSTFRGLKAREDSFVVFSGALELSPAELDQDDPERLAWWNLDRVYADFAMSVPRLPLVDQSQNRSVFTKGVIVTLPESYCPFPFTSGALLGDPEEWPHEQLDSRNRFLTLTIPAALQHRLEGFLAASMGYPSRSRGGFARMLYLSTITITTLGYGDIVPMTSRARLLVSLESILGLAIMGLFVATVAGRLAGQRGWQGQRTTPN